MVYQLPKDQAREGSRQMNPVASGLKQQVGQRPWTALGLSVAAGYALGSVVGGADTEEDRRTAAATPTYSAGSYASGTMSYEPTQPKRPATLHDGDGARARSISDRAEPPRQSGSSMLSTIMGQFDDQLSALASTAGSALLGLIHDTIKQDAPELHRQIERARRERGLPPAAAASAASPSQAARSLGAPEASRFDM